MGSALLNRVKKADAQIAALKGAILNDVQQVQRVALACLSDTELQELSRGEVGAMRRYQEAFDLAAIPAMGRVPPTGGVAAELIAKETATRSQSKLAQIFPGDGPLRRDLYPKHVEFFRAGRDHREVGFIAANRCGKSEAGGYQTALHLTGLYPPWWEGKRFDRPINAWMISDTNQTTRDILQAKLLGRTAPGSKDPSGSDMGMIPADRIVRAQPKSSTPGAVETALIRHISGGLSRVTFKSYQQGREAFQGTEQDLIVCDEEPPMEVYAEALMRTMDTTGTRRGLVLLLFTPLRGWSEVVDAFLNPEKSSPERYCVQAGWDDVPHLSAAEKESMLAAIPEYQRDARAKGIPRLGSGAIYPIAESEIETEPFKIPEHWPRVYGLDVGWKRTAALWLAQDPNTRELYAYAEHYYAEAEPSENVREIVAHGAWIPGVIDPAANGRSQADGTQLMTQYRDLGLDLKKASNTVEAGLSAVRELLVNHQLKIFKNLSNFWSEYRLYRRDERGRVVKQNDHLMDCLRYAVMSGRDRMITKPTKKVITAPASKNYGERGWMA